MNKYYNLNESGYYEYKNYNPKRISNLVHRNRAYKEIYLKCIGDYPLPFEEYEVHHINWHKKDNRISNLKIVTIKEHKEIHKYTLSNFSGSYSGNFLPNYSNTIFSLQTKLITCSIISSIVFLFVLTITILTMFQNKMLDPDLIQATIFLPIIAFIGFFVIFIFFDS